MKQYKITAAFFSPVGSTEMVCHWTAKALQSLTEDDISYVNFTLPREREIPENSHSFGEADILIIGMPTYAGRLPNKIMPYVKEAFHGEGTFAIPIVTYGNRNFDDSLIELRDILEENGFRTIGGAAFVSNHSFATKLAQGRPNQEDEALARLLGQKVIEKLTEEAPLNTPVEVPGNHPVGPYYTPKGLDGQPVKFLKAKPVTSSMCHKCKVCASVCPMGSISGEDPRIIEGICIKCSACVRNCPSGAKSFEDEAFLSHKAYLEKNYAGVHRDSEIFY